MDYKDKGKEFCSEINNLLATNNLEVAFVTGGGFAYDSIKYNDNKNAGDFDFMIVYNEMEDVNKILRVLEQSNFRFEEKYLNLDLELLSDKIIDIVRLSGKYAGIKSTINLVPKGIVEKISDFNKDLVIKKIAHNRNTSLFFAYGSDNSRIITNFISPSFITEDGEDHYIHLDFSHTEKDGNIYLGILADAILKGFNSNYDAINFRNIRKKFICNIHKFFFDNGIDSSNFISLFSNNNYFPEYLKTKILAEFNSFGTIIGKIEKPKKIEPIIFTTNVDVGYEKNSFNFINNKEFKTRFDLYIINMQNNEYDRQYLLDSIGKFFGYLMSSTLGNKEYEGSILDKILVYGVNDLYLPEFNQYSMESIIKAIISDIKKNSEKLNNELVRNYYIICFEFLKKITGKSIESILSEESIGSEIFNRELESKISIDVINKLDSFNEIGTYHTYSSEVMPRYTINEAKFIEKVFSDKNAKILDVMCGYGRLCNQLVKDGYTSITGIDTENYSFLGVPKDFIFINHDFLTYNFNEEYDCAYSLYNCYSNIDDLMTNINKVYSVLAENGLFIIDFFNKHWRDSIDPLFFKELYADDISRLVVKRYYDSISGDENTKYELYNNDKISRIYNFTQKFFYLNDVIKRIDLNKWKISSYNSDDLLTRNNEQKNILILRKKV